MDIGPPWAVSPKDWGAKAAYDSWNDHYTPDEGIAIHHGGGGDYPAGNAPFSTAKEVKQLLAWEKYHMSKGWRGIAYGWAIGQSGTVYRLRGWNRYGAHLGDIDKDGISNEEEIIPVLFITSGLIHEPSPALLASFEKLRAWIEAQCKRSLYLYGHKEVQPKPTSCPGPKNMAYVVNNRYLVGVPMIARPSEAVIDWAFDSGLATGDRNYWKQLPAGNEAWARFTQVLQGGLVRWAFEKGYAKPNNGWAIEYWLTLSPGSPEWSDFYAALGDHAPTP